VSWTQKAASPGLAEVCISALQAVPPRKVTGGTSMVPVVADWVATVKLMLVLAPAVQLEVVLT